MILLSKKEIDAVLNDWGKNPEGRDYSEEVAKAQLKAMVKYLKTCKGELVSKDGRPFVATFGIPVEDWQSILEEIE